MITSYVFCSEESATLTYRLGMGMLHEDSHNSATNDSKTSTSLLPGQSNFTQLKEHTKPISEPLSKDDIQNHYTENTTDQPLKVL